MCAYCKQLLLALCLHSSLSCYTAVKEQLKYYELILKKLQGFINETHHTAVPTAATNAVHTATAGSSYAAVDFDDDSAV